MKPPFSKDNVIVPRDLRELRGLVLLKLSSDQYTEDVPFISLDSHGLLFAVTLSLVCCVALTVATLIKGTFLVINEQIANNDYLYSLYWGTAYVLGCMVQLFQWIWWIYNRIASILLRSHFANRIYFASIYIYCSPHLSCA